MKVLVATEARVLKSGDKFYTNNSFVGMLKRYHDVFRDITLCTRITSCDGFSIPRTFVDVTELIEDTVELNSLAQIILRRKKTEMKLKIQGCDLVIARVPSIVSHRVAIMARELDVPYMVEVTACAWDSYWNYSFFSKFLAIPFFLDTRNVVRKANYAVYVTERFLQNRYPCRCESIHASNVNIHCGDNRIIDNRLNRIQQRNDDGITLFTAAAVDVPYKGQEYVIRAMEVLVKKGLNIRYRLAGNGNQSRLKRIAKECNVSDRVLFLGGLVFEEVINELDRADIYIQPSLQEGLPRSLIEAMSRGCPALGANTAGIPELIDKEFIFKRADSEAIVQAVLRLIDGNMKSQAIRNFEKAKEYDYKVLEERRNKYYQEIINKVICR